MLLSKILRVNNELKKISYLLILGLINTVFYKAVIGLVPFAANNTIFRNSFAVFSNVQSAD
jgi:hypothetical protein